MCVCSGGKGQFSESLSNQLELMALDLKKSQQQVCFTRSRVVYMSLTNPAIHMVQVSSLTRELSETRRQHRLKHDKLVTEFTRSMQIREDASTKARGSEVELRKMSDSNTKAIQVSVNVLRIRVNALLGDNLRHVDRV